MRLPDGVNVVCYGIRELGATCTTAALMCGTEEAAISLLHGWEQQNNRRGEIVELLIKANVLGTTRRK